MQDARLLFRISVAIVTAVTLARILVLIASPLELYPDEAQYWWWAQTPDFGYYSKPPLIAWVIRATTAVFGDREWAIRLGIPILHGGAALIAFAVARSVWPNRPSTALWSALAYLTLPGVSYSSGLASTDAPLLFFWSLALWAFLRSVDSPHWRWPLLCGAALGLGILAKYAMVFFLVGGLIAAFGRPAIGRMVFGPRGIVIVVLAAAIVSPNIVWNITHGYPTLVHVEANAGWTRARLDPLRLLAFAAGQFGVFGPFLMAAWLACLWRVLRARKPDAGAWALAAFSTPPAAAIAVQSLVAAANANWAATAYVAAVPLAVAEIERHWPRWTLYASFTLHALVALLLATFLVIPSAADRLGFGNVFKRQEGWRNLGGRVLDEAARGGFTVVAADNRSIIAELVYYARRDRLVLRMWDHDRAVHNHFDMTMRLEPPAPRVLLVLPPADADDVLPSFESARLLATLATRVGGGHMRVLCLYDVRSYRGPPTHG